jgi:hypothetical protein
MMGVGNGVLYADPPRLACSPCIPTDDVEANSAAEDLAESEAESNDGIPVSICAYILSNSCCTLTG